MKVVGRIFLIVSGILFLVWGITGLVSNIKETVATFQSGDVLVVISWVIAIAACVIQILAAIGGFFYAAGSKKLSRLVGFFAVITLVFVIANLVTAIIGNGGFPVIWISGASTATAIIYALGWLFLKKKR